jgi:hypothetical protein
MMKILIENKILLLEKTFDLDVDVDWIYDKFFKKDIDEIKNTGMVGRGMFIPQSTSTASLKSSVAKRAHLIKPCEIFINSDYIRRAYVPSLNSIYINVNDSAVHYILWECGGSLNIAVKEVGSKIKREFEEAVIKSHIYHELSHWIDDVLHNNITTREVGKKQKDKKIRKYIDFRFFEINAQIHAIKQLKRNMGDEWDEIKFSDLKHLIPSLGVITRKHVKEPDKVSAWERKLKKRMHREGLLGKNMKK